MAVVYHYCNEPASSSDLPCISCKSFYHHVCLFPASIISKSWTHINGPPPSYALAIFSSPNFTFTCPSCLINTSSNTSTTFSSTLVTPTHIHRNNPPIRPTYLCRTPVRPFFTIFFHLSRIIITLRISFTSSSPVSFFKLSMYVTAFLPLLLFPDVGCHKIRS